MKLHEITDEQHRQNQTRELIYKVKKSNIKFPWQFNYMKMPSSTHDFAFIYKYTPEKPAIIRYIPAYSSYLRIHIKDEFDEDEMFKEVHFVNFHNYLNDNQGYTLYFKNPKPCPEFKTFVKCFKLFEPNWKLMNLHFDYFFDSAPVDPFKSFLLQQYRYLHHTLKIPTEFIKENSGTPPQFWLKYCSPY